MKKWTLNRMIRELKQAFPLDKPVTVSVRHLRDQGSCAVNDKRIYITLSNTIRLREKKEVLLHEWAHALAGWDDEPHSGDWGKKYAQLCRWWYDE